MPHVKMTPVAIFVRVSKGGQDYTRQVADLTAFCEKHNYTIVQVLAEKISGIKNNKERVAIQELIGLAKSQKIKKVLVTEVSRLGRKTSEVLQVMEELTELNISVFVQNYNMETLTPEGKRNPVAQLIFTFLAEFARLERETMIERICSGLDAAKRKGVTLGRKKGSTQSNEQILQKNPKIVRYLKEGAASIREIAKLCEVSPGKVQKVKTALLSKE